MVAGVICVLLVLVAIFATQLAPYAVDATKFDRLASPSLSHPFGTDNLFRDIFSRMLVGSRISLGIGFAAVLMGTVFGTLLGMVSGYFGGWADHARVPPDRCRARVPAARLPVVFPVYLQDGQGLLDQSFFWVSLAIGIIITPTTARIVRGSVLSIRNLQFVEAANGMGSSPMRIMWRHVLPNVIAPIIVIASIQIGNAILAEAAISFLGQGIADDSHPSWGKMLQDTRSVWHQAWWVSVVPGAAISLAVLSFNLFGDALRDVLDPRLRSGA